MERRNLMMGEGRKERGREGKVLGRGCGRERGRGRGRWEGQLMTKGTEGREGGRE